MKSKPLFIRQLDQTDCGVTCLLTIIRTLGGNSNLETLRILSGTGLHGTTLLGLQQAAEKNGMKAEAYQVDNLTEFKENATFPCILHVIPNQKLEHYVVCTGLENGLFHITDPATGFEKWTEEMLLQKWKSRVVLLLQPGPSFRFTAGINRKTTPWFVSMIRPDFPVLLASVLFGAFVAVLGMATAVFSQKLVDVIIPAQKMSSLWAGIFFLLILLTARSGLNFIRSGFLVNQSREFNNRLTGHFLERLLQQSFLFFDGRKNGEILARLQDTRRIQAAVSYIAGNLVIDLMIFLISMVFICLYSWKAFLICLSAIPVSFLLAWRFHGKIINGQKMVMSRFAASESQFLDIVDGITVIKSHKKESLFSGIGRTVYRLFQEQVFLLGKTAVQYTLSNEILTAILLSLVLGFSARQVIDGTLRAGELVAILSISISMFASLSRLMNANIQIQEARIAFERISEFSDVMPEAAESGMPAFLPEKILKIDFRKLWYRFPGKNVLLKDISMSADRGELTLLTGDIGTGKSILFQILQRFREPDHGRILINGETDLHFVPVSQWRSRLGVVQQEVKIFNGSIADNILLGSDEYPQMIQFCADYGFSCFFEKLPRGYQTQTGEDGIKLSGGQKQLISLARALYRNPEVLLLDEPTASMDKKTEAFVMNLLDTLKKDRIILMISHRNAAFSFADKIFTLEDGSVFAHSISRQKTASGL